jgi:hypothetical protein
MVSFNLLLKFVVCTEDGGEGSVVGTNARGNSISASNAITGNRCVLRHGHPITSLVKLLGPTEKLV